MCAVLGALALAGCPQGCKPPPRADRFRPKSIADIEKTPLPAHFRDAGGADADDDSPDPGGGHGEPDRADTLVVAISREPTNLNPLLDIDAEGRLVTLDLIYEPLVHYSIGPTGVGAVTPGIADAWSVDLSGKKLELELRAGARWHDGRAVEAADVEFTINTVRAQKAHAGHLQALLADIDHVESVSPRVVRIYYTRASTYALRNLAEVAVLPAHSFGADLNHATATRAPIGSGPYRFVRWHRGHIILDRAADYDLAPAGFQHLEFVIEPDGARALTRAKQGEIDVIAEVSPSYVPNQIDSPALGGAFERVDLGPPRFLYLAMNVRKGRLLEDVRLRRALAYLIDRTAVVENGYRLGEPIASPVWPGGPVTGKAAELPAHDDAAAVKLLEYLEWSDRNRDGVRERLGAKLSLRMLAVDGPLTHALTDKLVPAARDAGILLSVGHGEPGFVLAKLRQGEFDLALLEYGGIVDEDLGPLLGAGGDDNFGGVGDAEVESALEWLRRAEPAERVSGAGRLSRVLADRLPIVSLARPLSVALVSRHVGGIGARQGVLQLREAKPR